MRRSVQPTPAGSKSKLRPRGLKLPAEAWPLDCAAPLKRLIYPAAGRFIKKLPQALSGLPSKKSLSE
jgi:hypothetical protein